MKLYNNDGFTLIELLIGINLSIFTFTLILSFFLTTSKLSYYFEKNLASKKKTEYFFEMFRKELDKLPDFCLNYNNSGLQISSSNPRSRSDNSQEIRNISSQPVLNFMRDTININDNTLAPVTWEMELLTTNGNTMIKSDKINDVVNGLNQGKIKEIILKVSLNNHEYLFDYIKPELPLLNFENI
jgi:hypothetical protein